MSGNPAARKPEKLYAYLLFDVIREVKDGVDIGSYVPAGEPVEGEITLRSDFPGTGTHAFRFEDGPITWHASGVYVGTGETVGEVVEFDLGVKKLLNLIAIGSNAEEILKQQIHDVLDKVKEVVESTVMALPRTTERDEDLLGDVLRAIDKLEKDLWRIH